MARILIVDDEALIVMALAYTFEDRGHEVRTASDGRRALDALQGFVPDVLITDYMMPRMSGTQLIAAVRERADLARLRIVLMSAIDRAKVNGIGRLCDAFIGKPFDEEEVAAVVQRLLGPEAAPAGS